MAFQANPLTLGRPSVAITGTPPTDRKSAIAQVSAVALAFVLGVVILGRVRPNAHGTADTGSLNPTPSASSASPGEGTQRAASLAAWSATQQRCNVFHRALARQQRPDGSFGPMAQANPNGWETSQQLFALLASDSVCGPLDPRQRLDALSALNRKSTDRVQAGPEARLLLATTGWSILALSENARRWNDETTRRRLERLVDDLAKAQLRDGSFPAVPQGDGTEPYTAVLSAWALTEAEGVGVTGAATARVKAISWVRSSLGDTDNPNSLRRLPALSERAVWAILRSRTLTHDRVPADSSIVSAVADDMLARCAPLTDPTFRCSREEFETGVLTIETAPANVKVVTSRLPWMLVSAFAVEADESLDLRPGLRASVGQLGRWGMVYAGEMRIELLRENPLMLADYLFAVSEGLRRTQGP